MSQLLVSLFYSCVQFYSHNFLGTTPSPQFFASTCNGLTPSGLSCDKLNSTCEMLRPCKNNASCTDNNTIQSGYTCLCPPEFDGNQCQKDHRLCKSDTCWNNGTTSLYFIKKQ
jgi:hypothetical protein